MHSGVRFWSFGRKVISRKLALLVALTTFVCIRYFITEVIDKAAPVLSLDEGDVCDTKPGLKPRLPKAIVIGAKKSGTSALVSWLNLHPQIVAHRGEVNFFNLEQNYKKGFSWYRNAMPKSHQYQITIESSPRYFILPDVPKRVRAMNSSIKLLLIVREPVSRLISDYIHGLRHYEISGTESFRSLLTISADEINSGSPLLQPSLYATQLSRWLQYFPKNQIHVVNGDILRSNPSSELILVEQFLNVKSNLTEKDFYWNKLRKSFCTTRGKTDLTRKDGCLNLGKGESHKKYSAIDDEFKLKLANWLREKNKNFNSLSGRDFGWA